ncbi:MAG: ferric reductase-like transmembrane domain-containing protein [Actinomycetota bacterium]|nr:ferric reductase-like transmembrane domain-containing protein [Actinomycetota bacterium]
MVGVVTTATTLDPGAPGPPSLAHRVHQAGQHTREGLVAALVAGGGLVVLGLWVHDTPGRSLHSLGDELTAAGRVTALLGTYLLLVQILLMARLPWLERLIGTTRLAVWHRLNGMYSVGLLVAHTVLTIWGYAVTDHAGLAHETASVVLTYPDVLMATVGLGLLLVVSVLSARAARRRLRYETWYAIHLYAYLGVGLSLSHQLATGADFTDSLANRVFWVGLFAGTAACLVVFRFVAPAVAYARHRFRVADVIPEGPGVVSIIVTGDRLEELRAEAGQFFRLRFLHKDGWWQSHPFSLSVAPNGRALRFTVKDLGDHTGGLSRLAPGTRVVAEGPYGAFTALRRARDKVLLIGGGLGITPVRALLAALPGGPGDITLLYRVSREDDLVFRTELEELGRRRGARIHYLVGPRTRTPDPIGPEVLASLVPDARERDVYLCGPTGMTDATAASLRALGVPRSRIHTERFDL